MSKTVNTPVTIPAAQAPLYVAMAQVQKPASDAAQQTMLQAYVALLQTHTAKEVNAALASPTKDEKAAAKAAGTKAVPNIVRTWVEMEYAETTAAKMHSQLRALVRAWYSGAIVDSTPADVIITSAKGYQKAITASVAINDHVSGKNKEAKEVGGLAEHIAAELLRIPAEERENLTAEQKAELQDTAIAAYDVAKANAAHNALVEKAQDAAKLVECVLCPKAFKDVGALVQYLSDHGQFSLAKIQGAIAAKRGKKWPEMPECEPTVAVVVPAVEQAMQPA